MLVVRGSNDGALWGVDPMNVVPGSNDCVAWIQWVYCVDSMLGRVDPMIVVCGSNYCSVRIQLLGRGVNPMNEK